MLATTSWDLTAILVLFVGCVLTSASVAILVKWALIRFAVELEYRVDSLEDRISREVKVRAQERSVESRKSKDDLVAWAQEAKEEPTKVKPQFSALDQWRHNKMVGKS